MDEPVKIEAQPQPIWHRIRLAIAMFVLGDLGLIYNARITGPDIKVAPVKDHLYGERVHLGNTITSKSVP